jgi:hypothetical protein
MEELKKISVAVRWARNGRKYVWEKPSQKKIAELISKYDYDQMCDGCLCGCNKNTKEKEKENEKTTHGRVYIKNCCGVK